MQSTIYSSASMAVVDCRCVSVSTGPIIETLVRHRAALLCEVNPKDRLLEDDYRRWLDGAARHDDCVHWLATEGGQIVASTSVTRWAWAPSARPGATGAFLYSLYVEPAHRRQGIATAMLREVFQWAQAAAIDHVTLLESPLAGDLYRHAGFQPVRRGMLAEFLTIGAWLWWSRRLVWRCGSDREEGRQ
jgi:GNAT superfamily N-acetyltransferase